LKDIDNETDFDYISSVGSLQISDVLLNRAIPSGRLKGTAVQIAFQRQRYYHQISNPDGTVTTLANLQALHILSSDDMKVYNANTMALFKNYEDQFYDLPENRRPQSIAIPTNGNGDVYMLNDGKVYTFFGMSAHIGVYRGPMVGFHSMHKDMLVPNMMNALLFDLESSSFFHATTSALAPTPLSEESPTAINPVGVSPNNMPYTLLALVPRLVGNPSATAYAVMRHKTNNTHHLATINYTGAGYPFLSFKTIPEEYKMPLSTVIAATPAGDFLYFAEENRLYVYKDADGLTGAEREYVLKTFPANETISFMQFLNNQVVVLTNSTSGWKLYGFSLIGAGNPEIQDTPNFTYSGVGTARNVMFR
jgi:hypothetical protein